LDSKLEADNIREGTDLSLQCVIDANPTTTQVSWLFDGKPLTSDHSLGIIVSNLSLELQRISRESRGRYSCVVKKNGQGTTTAAEDFLLDVLCEYCFPFI